MKYLIVLIIGLLKVQISFCQVEIPANYGECKNIKHQYYTVCYNEEHEQANWVYYKLTASMVDGTNARKDNFREDPYVITGSATLIDFKGSGYDRGHLCPAGDMKVSTTAMDESFYMSNMSPQDPSFNRGIWRTLESNVRYWAKTENEIYVVTGPVFKDNLGSIGVNQVTVPGYYYKVIYDPTGEQKMIALVLPHRKGEKRIQEYVVTVDYLEALTNIDFFPYLPDELENRLESENTAAKWNFKTYTPSNSSTTTAATQCKGIAKSTGVRCKNKTTNANGYCHYHQSQANNSNKKITPTQKTSNRCQAITKSGTQCKRKAEAGSRYCWQHK